MKSSKTLLVLAAILVVLAVASTSAADDRTECDTLVLCPDAFRTALNDWLEYRQHQGHRILVVAPARTAYQIRQQVREIAANGVLKNLVIIGDATDDHHQGPAAIVPTDYQLAKVNLRYGGEPEIATDFTYADIDDDGLQDLTVGRIPVDTADELKTFCRKIINYEQSTDFGKWRRQINLVAGVGNFEPIVDGVIERTTRRLVADLVPPWFDTRVTVANWQSPYCPDPRRLKSVVVDQFNEGCLFWVFVGHGSYRKLAPMEVGPMSFPVLGCQDVPDISCQHGLPIAIFLACYTGAFDAPRDCLAEDLVRRPAGPVACICGSRMTMPYGLAVFSYELLQATSHFPDMTLGELMRESKRKLCMPAPKSDADNDSEYDYRALIETLGKVLSPTADMLDAERREHAQMIHLIGDPLLRIARPQPLQMQIDSEPTPASEVIQVSGIADRPGELTIELCYNRDRLRTRPTRRLQFDLSSATMKAYDEMYSRANDMVCCQTVLHVAQGEFSAELTVPSAANGECQVRGYLRGEDRAWTQALPILLR